MGFEVEEYKEIYYNYTKYDYLKPLILDIQLYPDNESPEYLKIKWIEEIQEIIYVDRDGWFVKDMTNKYPTFESLAMRQSNKFNQKWGETLYTKLQELEEEEEKK
jgi:hypothetical protein